MHRFSKLVIAFVILLLSGIVAYTDRLDAVPAATAALVPATSTSDTPTYAAMAGHLPGSQSHIGDATGAPLVDPAVAATSNVPVAPRAGPAITVTKTADTDTPTAGHTIIYTYRITNTGDVTLDPVVAHDDRLGEVTLQATSLLSGAVTSGQLTYTLPSGTPPGPLVNTVTVTGTPDAAPDVTAADTLTLTIINLRPIADAGFDRDMPIRSFVSLNGANSIDPDGHLPLSYRWAQTGGTPTVILSSDTVSRPNFIAPDTPTVLTFTLAVIDAQGLGSDPDDDVVVTISAHAPQFVSTPVEEATAGMTYTYAIIATDIDPGDALTITTTTKPDWLALTDHGDGTATLSGKPTNEHAGANPVALLVHDTIGLTDTQSFTITVVANTPPTISDIPDQRIHVNSVLGPIPFTIGDAETAAVDLSLSAQSSNVALVPSGAILLGGSGADRTVTITPTANLTGTATITITVGDGIETDADTFKLTVEPYRLYLPLIVRNSPTA